MKHSSRTRHFYIASMAARFAAFAFLVGYALRAPERFSADLAAGPAHVTPVAVVWLLLILSMVFRFFPSKTESLGCQKEFAGRFVPTGKTPSRQEIRDANRGALWVAVVWIIFNGLFIAAFLKGWLSERFMVCLAAFYGVCDNICILFFCPFQSWMMHNRCCTTCRIYNWDYLMMCTPLLCLKNLFALSACLLALALFLRWEFTYLRRRERFFESCNSALQCSNCQEQLCKYKRTLSRAARRSKI